MVEIANKITIVTDSVADLPADLIKKYDIRVVPLYIRVDGVSYRENLEIDPDRVYSALLSGSSVKTSTPPISDFTEIYRDIKENKGSDIIYSIHLSSALSGTINSAISAAGLLDGIKIKIVDSKRAAIGEGFLVLAAAEAAKRGEREEVIDQIIEKIKSSSFFYATFDNFEYVLKGGRAPFLAGFVGKAMVLRPVITFKRSGRLNLRRFYMNRRSSIIGLHKLIRSDIIKSGMGKCLIGICYGNDSGPAGELRRMIEDDPEIDAVDFIMTKMTSVMAAHTGPGIWGIAACPAY